MEEEKGIIPNDLIHILNYAIQNSTLLMSTFKSHNNMQNMIQTGTFLEAMLLFC